MEQSRWRVSIDSDTCVGYGMCAGIAQAFFRLDHGFGTPIADEIDADDEVVNASESCPAQAILVREIGTDRVVAPLN
ncbi:ferredoxin [Streptomyces mirabilis]|uniref:ferredoxin n=1 Tax=Streptomyces mirabilis TaxID=68239 RepID=UPI0033240ACC